MTTQHISAAQPAAYWTGLAYESLISFIRAQLAEIGFTQPQFWLLRNLSKNDISPDGHHRAGGQGPCRRQGARAGNRGPHP